MSSAFSSTEDITELSKQFWGWVGGRSYIPVGARPWRLWVWMILVWDQQDCHHLGAC